MLYDVIYCFVTTRLLRCCAPEELPSQRAIMVLIKLFRPTDAIEASKW